MAKIFYTNLNLNGNQLQNAVIHTSTSAPSDAKVGQLYYNTTDKLMYQFDGTNWQVVGGVTSFGGARGAITVGNGLQMNSTDTNKVEAKVNTTASAGVALSVDGTNGIQAVVTTLDTDSVITDSATSVVSGKGVRDAINALDSTAELNYGLQSHTPSESEYATQKITFLQTVTETDGKIATTTSPSTTLYFTKAVTAADPLVVKSDLSGVIGALVYKGTAAPPTSGTEWTPNPTATPSELTTGWLYVVSADATLGSATTLLGKNVPAGTYHIGDMLIYDGTDWQAIEGNVPVDDKNLVSHAGGSLQEIAVVNGKSIHLQTVVDGGTATIATVTDGVVTLHAGLQQVANSGTIENNGGDNILLAKVATTGTAADVEVPSGSGFTSLQTLGALQELKASVENLDVASYKQAELASDLQGVTFYGIQEVDGKISRGNTDDDFVLALQGAYNGTTNKVALQSTITDVVSTLDADITSDDAAVAIVEVKEVDGKIDDVVVTNISAGVAATTTSGSEPTITVTTSTGAVTGADIATIKSYVDARSLQDISNLDVAGIQQVTTSSNGITINGIKEEDGKIAHDSSQDVTIVTDGTYDNNNNKVALQGTVTTAIESLDVSEYAQASITNAISAATVGGSIAIKGIKEEDGKIAAGENSVTLTADRGLGIYGNKIGHTNSVTAQTSGLGSVDSETTHTSKIVTDLKYDAQGHITAATETEIVAAAIKNAASGNLTSTNVQAALQELQADIDTITVGTAFKGAFSSSSTGPFDTTTTHKVGDQWMYNGSGNITWTSITTPSKIYTIEPNDMVIVSAIDASSHTSDIAVFERNLTRAVTNSTATSLGDNTIVLGAGNDSVKNSSYVISTTGIAATDTGNDTDILTSKATITTIANRINVLDATVTQTAAADNGMLALSVTETDGKLTSISGSVSATDGTEQLSWGSAVTLATIAGITIDAKLDTLETVAASTEGGVQLSSNNNTLQARLIDNSVTTAKIVDGNVTFGKIASANIQDGTTTTSTQLTTKSYVDEQISGSGHIKATKKALTFTDGSATLTTSTTGAAVADTTIVEVRNISNEVVEFNVTYSASDITISSDDSSFAGTGFYAIIHSPANYAW